GMDAGRVVDALRLERQPVPDVTRKVHARHVLDVGVDPPPAEVVAASPVQGAHLDGAGQRLWFGKRFAHRAQATPTFSSNRHNTLSESNWSSAIARAARACRS